MTYTKTKHKYTATCTTVYNTCLNSNYLYLQIGPVVATSKCLFGSRKCQFHDCTKIKNTFYVMQLLRQLFTVKSLESYSTHLLFHIL